MFNEIVERYIEKFTCVNCDDFRCLANLLYFWGVFSPLLQDWGVRVHKPIAVVCERDNAANSLSELLCIFSKPRVIAMSEPQKIWQQKLLENCGDIAIFAYRKSPQAERNTHKFCDAIAVGQIGEAEIHTLPIVCFASILPVSERRNYFVVNIEKNTFEDKKVVALPDNLLDVFIEFAIEKQKVLEWEVTHFIEEQGRCFENEFEKAMLAAAVIWKVFLTEAWGKTKADVEFDKVVKVISEYVSRDEEEKDMYGIGAVFISLFSTQTQDRRMKVYNKNKMSPDYCKERDYVIFDDCYYYITESFLKVICEPLLQSLGIGMIKQQLADEAILVPNQTQDACYTIKVPLCFAYGNIERKRLIRLNREMIDVLGEPDLTMREETDNGEFETRKIRRGRCLPGTE